MIKKLTYSIFVNLSIILVLIVIVYGFSNVYAFFNTGADKRAMLLLASEQLGTVYHPKVTWLNEDLSEGRKMEAATKNKVESDYLASYYYQYQASSNGLTEGLKDFYTESSRESLVKLVDYYEVNEESVNGTTIEHFITPKFYSEDGTVIIISDEVISYNESIQKGKKITFYDSASYDIMLLLEDNYWRIRHKVRNSNQVKQLEEKPKKPGRYKVEGSKFYELGKVFQLKCINYYPSANPWTEMWENFEADVIKNDFMKIKSMGFNSVRIFVSFEQFGKDVLEAKKLNDLNEVMSIADELNLKVIVTLFDFFLSYQITEWTISDRHAEQIVSSIMDHPSLFAWDVKNEPDLDFKNYGKEEVEAWLDFIIRRIKTYDPNHFVTIGWSQPEISADLSEIQDFISFHFYRDPIELTKYLNSADLSDKPVFLGETGMHSYSSWWFPFSKSQQEQADYVEEVLTIIEDNQLNYGLWTLHDFKNIPSNVAGKALWKKNPQKRYGLIDKNGKEKKIYNIILNFNCDEK